MFCHKCGAQIAEGATFCHKCGTKVAREDIESRGSDVLQGVDNTPRKSNFEVEQEDKESKPKLTGNSDPEKGLSKLKLWWNNCSRAKRILAVLGIIILGIFLLSFLVSFLREFGYLLFGILVIASLIFAVFTGSKEERSEARKTLVQLVGGLVIICGIAVFIALNPDIISDTIRPGSTVRNAYLTQYSEDVTVEDAFTNFFADEKWSTYKSEGYSYVVFTGSCEYDGQPADVRVTFKITGEHFRVDGLDINGVEQNDLVLALMLAKVYEEY